MEDKELIKGVMHGSVPALKRLAGKYIPLVSRTTYRIMCDRSDSEYVTKEVFIALWHDPRSFMVQDDLSHEMLKRACRMCRKRLLRRKLYMMFSVHPDVFVISTPTVHSAEEYMSRQVWEVFCRASLNCTDRQKIVYALHELEGVPLVSVADAGYYLPFTVEEALEEARSRVKEELGRYGRIGDYDAYVEYLRRVEYQLTDKTRLLNMIMQELFS